MGLERYPDEQIGQSKYIDPIADYQMNVNDHVVRPFSSGAMPQVRLATDAVLDACTATGGPGVGKTLTKDALTINNIDGVAPVVGDLIMVKDQGTAADNGIYIVTVVGAAAAYQTLVRAVEYDATSDFALGDLFYVTEGTANAGLIGHVSTLPAILDTNDIDFTLGIYAAITITLPPVFEAKGKFYSIVAKGGTVALPITIADSNDSDAWEGDFTLDAVDQSVLLYSDGLKWVGRTQSGIASLRGGSAAVPVVRDEADYNFVEFRFDNGATSGDNRGIYNRLYLTGAGGSGESFRSYTDVVGVACNTAHGAHISLGFGESTVVGSITGQGAAVRATLGLPSGDMPAGTYAAILPEIWSFGAATTVAGISELSFIRCVNGGDPTGVALVDDKVFFAVIAGGEIGDDHLLRTNTGGATHGIKCWFHGVRYDILCTDSHS